MNVSSFTISDLENLAEFQPADWGDLHPRFQYFINSSFCTPVKLTDHKITTAIGTAMLHENTAWLACIIVHPDHRKKGLGKILTQKLIDGINRQKFRTIYLDATEMGYPVYNKLGFEVETEYVHLKKESPAVLYADSVNIFPFHEEFREEILQLDEHISGEKRRGILSDFVTDAQIYLEGNRVTGFYIPGWGDGPVIAENTKAGIELMKLRFQHSNSAVVPIANYVALDFLKENHFIPFKTSKRMLLGEKRKWKPDGSYNRISGQLG